MRQFLSVRLPPHYRLVMFGLRVSWLTNFYPRGGIRPIEIMPLRGTTVHSQTGAPSGIRRLKSAKEFW